MKKYKLVILIFCVFLVLLCSCGKTTTQELKPSETSIFVQIDNEYDLSSLFEASWAKQVAFSTNDTHLISLNGSKVLGKKEGVAEVFAIYSNSFCSITVNVVKNQEDVPGLAYVTDTYVVYNGKEQFIDINNVPINSTIKYYSNGKEFKGATNVGEYVISVKVFDSNGKELSLSKDTATLCISKATYDLDVRFSKYSFVYDGQEKEVTLLGDLPEGMQVTLVNNKHTEVGEYIVRADFNNPNPDNYYDCDSKIVNMVISRKFVYLKDYNFEDKTVVYNADYQTINLDKNIDGVDSIRFYTFENDEFVKVNQEPHYIDSGEYIYGISIDLDEERYNNYQYVAYSENIEFEKLSDNQYSSNIVSVKFKITKATLVDTSKLELVDVDGNSTTSINYKDRIKTPWDNLDNYDYEFVITGSLSTGIKNEFDNKISIEYFKTNNFVKNEYDNYNYGSYIVGAAYRIDADYEKNYEKVNDLTLSFEIKKIHYNLENASFVYNKSKVEYDKDVNYENEMGVTGVNDVNISIRYFFYKDNGAYIYRDLDNIKNVGSYSIFASFEILNDKDNYYTIPDMYQRYANSDSQLFVIEKKKITLSEITFADLTKTYDGVECSINATGNTNEDVTISYTINGIEGNSVTNAGTYSVKAYFKYKDYENSNVSFTINDLTGNTLTATLTIQKATYTKE
ncbi:MAG: MBG domain-containing protein, partial [Clostridia bacterium]|nr:MBG domain-containing protein [Clostridia bacterium]